MNILITGAKGFVGKNLVENLKTIRDGKNKTRQVVIEEIYECKHHIIGTHRGPSSLIWLFMHSGLGEIYIFGNDISKHLTIQ